MKSKSIITRESSEGTTTIYPSNNNQSWYANLIIWAVILFGLFSFLILNPIFKAIGIVSVFWGLFLIYKIHQLNKTNMEQKE